MVVPPLNQNFLGKNGFVFNVVKLPNTDFFIQQCSLPGLSIDPVLIGNPLVSTPYSGDHITYQELEITFKVDEDMGSYIDVHNWMRGLGFPEDNSEYAKLIQTPVINGGGIYSDISLIVLDAKKRANYEFTFIDAFPVSLSTLQLGYDVTDVEYITADASFRYRNFSIQRIKDGFSQLVQNPGG